MKKVHLKLLCLFSFLIFLSCKTNIDTAIGTPKIKAGTAKITGKILSPNDRYKENATVEIMVPHPVSGEISNYKANIDESGKFSIDVDVETDVSLIGLYTSLKPYNSLLFKVREGGVTNLDITYSMNLEIEDVQTKPEMNKYEIMRSLPIINKMLGIYDPEPDPPMPLNDTRPEAFLKHLKTTVSGKLHTIEKDSLLSEEWKKVLVRDLSLFYYRVGAFDYEKSIKMAYRNKFKDSTLAPKVQKIDRSYFSFLKDLDLNNSQYLICSNFTEFQKEILKNEILAVPKIEDTEVISWLSSVKSILSDLVGFKEGAYYDILAANAYGKQLIEEKKPLTEKQKKNIAEYWKEGEIAKILLRKNQQIVKK